MKPHFKDVMTLIVRDKLTGEPLINIYTRRKEAEHGNVSAPDLRFASMESCNQKSIRLQDQVGIRFKLYTGVEDLATATVSFNEPDGFLSLIRQRTNHNWDTNLMEEFLAKYMQYPIEV